MADGDIRHPYDFASWHGDEPFPGMADPAPTHDQWHDGLLSGVLDVELVAESPVFIPEGTSLQNDDRKSPRRFWRCRDASGQERAGIPGSSLKGALRSLYEIWTNSHLTLVSTSHYEKPIPYRRRSATGWVVTGVREDGSRTVRGCDIWFGKWDPELQEWEFNGRRRIEDRRELDRIRVLECVNDLPRIDPEDREHLQAVPFRANLLWVPKERHSHGRHSHLIIQVGKGPDHVIPKRLVDRYLEFLDHPAMKDHPNRVQDIARGGPGRNYYRRISERQANESVADRETRAALETLEQGDILFAPEPERGSRELACFGKNVHFLWPSQDSPRKLTLGFWPRAEESLRLQQADPAEAAFGFAAPHRKDESRTVVSHPFRGRIRPTTFWAGSDATEESPLEMPPLTSPTGIKLKERATYLPPAEDGRVQTYDGEARTLRGRKLYWHQGSVRRRRPADPESQLPPPVRPLAKGTTFTGRIEFDNLSRAELGALLACLRPEMVLGGKAEEFGFKIGRGKPHGLGSVRARGVSLRLRRDPTEAYASLEEESWVVTDALEPYAEAFGEWVRSRAGKELRDVEFARCLKPLLTLRQDGTFEYPGPGKLGWQPDFECQRGDPHRRRGRESRPKAIPLLGQAAGVSAPALKPKDVVDVLIAGRNKKGNLTVRHESSGTDGTVVNSSDVPADLAVDGQTIRVICGAVFPGGKANFRFEKA